MGGVWIFGQGDDKGTFQWQPDPNNGRGTWTILSTCIITLFLCVYTALHLNIPAYKSSKLSLFGIRLKYVFFGLLAPEVLVFNSWRQRTVASSIMTQIRLNRGGKQQRSSTRKFYQRFIRWTKAIHASAKSLRWRHIKDLIEQEKDVSLMRDFTRHAWN
jgi:hypothetical protein